MVPPTKWEETPYAGSTRSVDGAFGSLVGNYGFACRNALIRAIGEFAQIAEAPHYRRMLMAFTAEEVDAAFAERGGERFIPYPRHRQAQGA
jgi:hypothetical protein